MFDLIDERVERGGALLSSSQLPNRIDVKALIQEVADRDDPRGRTGVRSALGAIVVNFNERANVHEGLFEFILTGIRTDRQPQEILDQSKVIDAC